MRGAYLLAIHISFYGVFLDAPPLSDAISMSNSFKQDQFLKSFPIEKYYTYICANLWCCHNNQLGTIEHSNICSQYTNASLPILTHG